MKLNYVGSPRSRIATATENGAILETYIVIRSANGPLTGTILAKTPLTSNRLITIIAKTTKTMKKLIFTLAFVAGTCLFANAQSTENNAQVTSGGTTIKPEMTTGDAMPSSCGSKSKSAGCCSSKKASSEASAKKSCCSTGDAKKSGCSEKGHGNDETRKEKD